MALSMQKCISMNRLMYLKPIVIHTQFVLAVKEHEFS